MLPRFADPKTDFVFKRVFGSAAHKHLLISLLNELLEPGPGEKIVDLEYLSPEERVPVPELKLSIVDVRCMGSDGRHFVVEMQVLNVEGFEKRVVYNVAKTYAMQLRTGEAYPQLHDVVGVTICDFELWPSRAVAGGDLAPDEAAEIPMLSRWRMREDHTSARGLPQLQFVFLELRKYRGGNQPQTAVEKWAYFFREVERLSADPPSLAEDPFREALDVVRASSFSHAEWEAYDRARIAEQDARGALALAQRAALEQGLEQGRRAMRAAVEGLCHLLGLRLDAAQRQHLQTASLAGLEALNRELLQVRRWPDP